mgnify:FL=1
MSKDEVEMWVELGTGAFQFGGALLVVFLFLVFHESKEKLKSKLRR